jgi:hypothetical protein
MVEKAEDGDELRVRGTCPGEVVISADLVIRGMGDGPTISGRGRTRVVKVLGTATARLHDLLIRGGHHSGFGGGIVNFGALRLIDSTVRDNQALAGGGGIRNAARGRLRLVRSALLSNHATSLTKGGVGGGLDNVGTGTVTNSTIADNGSEGSGGGIFNRGRLTLTSSIVRDNGGGEGDGGASNLGRLELIGSTVSGNGGFLAGGIGNGGRLSLVGTTVTGNDGFIGAGGIENHADALVRIDGTSSVTGNSPPDCRGTAACYEARMTARGLDRRRWLASAIQ